MDKEQRLNQLEQLTTAATTLKAELEKAEAATATAFYGKPVTPEINKETIILQWADKLNAFDSKARILLDDAKTLLTATRFPNLTAGNLIEKGQFDRVKELLQEMNLNAIIRELKLALTISSVQRDFISRLFDASSFGEFRPDFKERVTTLTSKLVKSTETPINDIISVFQGFIVEIDYHLDNVSGLKRILKFINGVACKDTYYGFPIAKESDLVSKAYLQSQRYKNMLQSL